jgi:DNA mismatch endonuclease, patch repair protein
VRNVTGRERVFPVRGPMRSDVRRRVMASIRKKATKPELALRRALSAAGARGYRCHVRLPGSPDLAFSRWRVAVFVDGVWWHGHPDHLPNGRRGPYWDAKIALNIARDKRVNRELRAHGWIVLRIWDLDVLGNPARAAARVLLALRGRGWRSTSARFDSRS